LSFSDFNLNKDFINSIESAGYMSPTDLQKQLIPLVNEKKSAIVWSQSASGKTGAFLIPAMNYILNTPAPEKRGARILILTSRRDRVSQINYTVKRLSKDLMMRFGFIVSGRPYQTQMRLMRRPLDIMIATPGRLNDLMNNGKADFSELEMLITDDLSSIYKKNLEGLVKNILDQADSSCSTITFVADNEETNEVTKSLFPDAVDIRPSAEEESDSEQEIQTDEKSPKNSVDQNKPKNKVSKNYDIPQKVHIADDYTHKIAMMDHLMDEFAGESTIIYTATTKAAKILQDNLSNHGHAAELVDDLDNFDDCEIIIYSDQSKTEISNDQMKALDENIIHFDLPHKTENYFDRLDRHDDQRKKHLLLMLDGYNFYELKNLEKALGEKLEQITIPGLEPLKPFINLSKKKPNTHPKKKNVRASTSRAKNKTNNKPKANNKPTNKKNTKTNTDKNQKPKRNLKIKKRPTNKNSETDPQRPNSKAPFRRVKSRIQRKNTRKVGVSRVGTDTPKGREGKSLVAEVKERAIDASKKVKISYNKKRTLSIKKPDEI